MDEVPDAADGRARAQRLEPRGQLIAAVEGCPGDDGYHLLDLVMVAGRYTLLDRAAAEDLLPAASERGIAVVAAAVYNSGLLSRPDVPSDAQFNYAPAGPDVLARARRMAEVCERHGVTLPDAALQFPLRHPAVTSVVVGLRSPAEVAGTIHRANVPIPDALWEDLEDLS